MKETPECPYCGAEMELHHIPDGLWWYQCGCCGAVAPSDETPEQVLAAALSRVGPCATCKQISKALCDKESTTLPELLNAVEQLKRRAEPENRVLTLAELKEHCKRGDDAQPLWIDFRSVPRASRWGLIELPDEVDGYTEVTAYLSNWANGYGIQWRCWLRKPTAEEMEREGWEK